MNTSMNILIILITILLLIAEIIICYALQTSFIPIILITVSIFFVFIIIQISIKLYTDFQKKKIKQLLNQILEIIGGIPIINKNEKIHIQWDIIFKDLIKEKELVLYDSILNTKTSLIEYYVNQYPSLLLDEESEMNETCKEVNTNSVIKKHNTNNLDKNNEESADNPYKEEIYIRQIEGLKAVLCNYDSSIYIDVILNEEFVPSNYYELKIDPDKTYDGFSVHAYIKDQKYIIVQRVIVRNKSIDKEKWFLMNIENIRRIIKNILENDTDFEPIVLCEKDIEDYTKSIYFDQYGNQKKVVYFDCVTDNTFYFNALNINDFDENFKIKCTLQGNSKGFELQLKSIESVGKTIEINTIVALSNSYDALSCILRNMPAICHNIELVLLNKELENILIK